MKVKHLPDSGVHPPPIRKLSARVRPPLREAPRKPRCALMDDDDAARGDADDATAAAGGGGGGDDDAVAPEDAVEADVAASVEQDGAGDGGGAGAGAGGAGSARGVGGL